MIYSKFSNDKKLESETGIKLDLGDSESITILRAGGSNRKHIAYVRAKYQAHRYKIEKNLMNEEEGTLLNADIYAETIIIAWEGIKDKDGNILEFTKENVIKILVDLPELFSLIKEEAEKFENFHEDEIKADEKN